MTDNELNALVAEQVMGKRIDPDDCGCTDCILGQTFNGKTIPDYCNDIAAAWPVVEKLNDLGFVVNLSTPAPGYHSWDVRGWRPATNDGRFIAHGSFAPRAICLAALEAVGGEVE